MEEENMTDEEPFLSPMAPAQPPAQPPAPRPFTDRELVRRWIRGATAWFAIAAMAVALFMLLYSANQLIVIWVKYQYIPMVRIVMALLIMGASAYAMYWVLKNTRD